MKKIKIIMVAVIFSLAASAQNDPTAPAQGGNEKSHIKEKGQNLDAVQRAAKLTERMAQQLQLTESQKKDILSINTDKAKRIDALRAAHGKEKKGLGTERKAIEQERDAEFKRVLSVEQYDKWIKLKAAKKEKKKNKKEKHENGNIKPEKKNQADSGKEDDNDDSDDSEMID
jgi:periplasmic protein CpxP/Spy